MPESTPVSPSSRPVVLAFGSRTWRDRGRVLKELRRLNPSKILTGDAYGADLAAQFAARQLKVPCEVFEADWKTYKKSAGPRRNAEMVAAGPDRAIAFVQGELRYSRGTTDTIRRLGQAGIPCDVITDRVDSTP